MLKNLIANYLGKLWAISSNFIFIPIYIRILGEESFGLVAFYSTVAMLISVLNLGLTSAVTRYVAQERINQNSLDTIKTVEAFLCFLCGLIVLTIYFLAPFITKNWITIQELDFDVVILSVRLMAVIASIEIMFSIYVGAYMALEKQAIANFNQFLFSFFKSALVIPTIYFFDSVESFFVWGALASAVILIVVRRVFWQTHVVEALVKINLNRLYNLKGFAIGMGVIGVLSAINSQLDKILVSSNFTLTQFGVYSLASTISQLPLIASTPIAATVLPRLSLLVKEQKNIHNLYRKFSLLVLFVSVISSILISIDPHWLISIWTGSDNIPTGIRELVRYLILSNLMLSLQLLPFQVLIAHGFTKVNIVLSTLSLVLLVPLMSYSINYFGMVGAAYPWVLLNCVILNVMVYMVAKKYLGKRLSNVVVFSIIPTSIYLIFLLFI